jgi:hypothetical protein
MLHAVTVGSSINAFSLQADITQKLKCRSIGNVRPWSVCGATRGRNDDAFLAFSRTTVSVPLRDIYVLQIRTI